MPSKLLAVGISHHSVPVEYREMVALDAGETRKLLEQLKDTFSDESLVLSTCNRSEIYIRRTNDQVTTDYLIDLLFELKQIPQAERSFLRPLFVRLSYCDAILHLFEVVTGLDSQIFGDQQIFTQVKDSFRLAEETGVVGTFMTKLAHAAFHVAKRVRTETTIAVGAGTISYAAVEFSRKVYDDLRNASALIIGAGETAELTSSYLIDKQIGTLFIANRSIERAEELLLRIREDSSMLEGRAIALDAISDILPSVDIVISSTGSPDLVLKRKDVESALQKRRNADPLVMIDIAVPRDIDPAIGDLPNVFLKNIDDLSAIIDQNVARRKDELPKIKAIINEEFESFLDLFTKLEVGPTIAELRKRFEAIRLEELERNRSKFAPEVYEKLDDMTRKMFNRVLHTPTVLLKEPRTTRDDIQARVELVRMLFDLDSKTDKRS